MLDFLYSISIYPLELLYKYLYIFCARLLDSYGFGLMCLSVVSTIIYHPMKKLAAGQQKKESDLRRVLDPQLARIKHESRGAERHQRINRLYRRYAYHPLKAARSSLGILMQVPLLIAAYHMIASFKPIHGLSFGPIADLGRPDGLLLGLNLLPILMTVFNIAAAYTARGFNSRDRGQALVVAFLFLALLYTAPSALLIYWTTNNFLLLVENFLDRRPSGFGDRLLAPPRKMSAGLGRLLSDNATLAAAISLPAFTYCFYGPVELFLNNSRDLWFDLETVLVTAAAGLAWTLALLTALGLLLKGRGRRAYALFMFGLGLALYAQGSFLQLDYGLLDGQSVDWAAYGPWGPANSLIWLLIIALPFIFSRLRPRSADRLIRGGALVLIAVEAATMLYLGQVQFGAERTRQDAFYLSTKNMFTVAPDENIVILLFDYMDVQFMDQALADYPELKESFTDFTFFHNTTSLYPSTLCAVPHILTGLQYVNQAPFPEYLLQAYRQSEIMAALRQEGYAIDIYTHPTALADSADYVTNFNNTADLVVNDWFLFAGLLYRFTGVKYLPHAFKKYVWLYTDDFDSTKTIDTKTGDPPYVFEDRNFYQALRGSEISIEAGEARKRFKFFHFLGSHPPWIYDEKLNPLRGEQKDAVRQTRGSLTIAEEFLRQMRLAGLYDRSAIIIMADHGIAQLSYFPSLMIKRPYERKPFAQTEAPVSYEDLPATMMLLMGRDPGPYGRTVYDWRPGDERERRFLRHRINSATSYLPPIREIFVSGNSAEVQDRPSGTVYAEGQVFNTGKTFQYRLGTMIDLRQGQGVEIYRPFFSRGLDEESTTLYTWSSGPATELNLTLADRPRADLSATVILADLAGTRQTIVCRANGQVVGRFEIDGRKDLSLRFDIPLDLVDGEGRLSLTFEYPLVADSSGRARAVAFRSLVVR